MADLSEGDGAWHVVFVVLGQGSRVRGQGAGCLWDRGLQTKGISCLETTVRSFQGEHINHYPSYAGYSLYAFALRRVSVTRSR